MASMTHPTSIFKAFTIPLSNGGTLSGIHHIPKRTSTTPKFRPLIVGIHGGTCTCHVFDVDPKHTASLAASGLGVPFACLSNTGTSPSLPIPEGSSYQEEDGTWLHRLIFPALWTAFGQPNDCSAIVALCHSLGAPGAIAAAALHARDSAPQYTLAGLIMSGWGSPRRVIPRAAAMGTMLGDDEAAKVRVRKLMMVHEDELCTHDPDIFKDMQGQAVPLLMAEMEGFAARWKDCWAGYAGDVVVPVMFGMGEHDWLWEGSREAVAEFGTFFTKCPRFDGSVVLGAGHAIEWSYASPGWYARCFGFAMEICAAMGVEGLRKEYKEGKI